MAAISDWSTEVRTRVSGAGVDIINQEIKSAIREFYRKSGLWVETLENLATSAVVSTLDLSAAAVSAGHDASVLSTVSIKYDNNYLIPQHVLDTDPTGDTPVQYYGLSAGSVRLIPTPIATVANIMDAVVVLQPLFTSDFVPNDAKDIWFDGIMDGILGRIMVHPKKPYTNAVLAQYHLKRFNNTIGEARDTARRRYTKTENSWTFPAWA